MATKQTIPMTATAVGADSLDGSNAAANGTPAGPKSCTPALLLFRLPQGLRGNGELLLHGRHLGLPRGLVRVAPHARGGRRDVCAGPQEDLGAVGGGHHLHGDTVLHELGEVQARCGL